VITCKGSVADGCLFGVSHYDICVGALPYVRALVRETVVRDHIQGLFFRWLFGVLHYYICVGALLYVRAFVREPVVRDHM